MTKRDRNFIETLPARYQPVGAWTYFGLSVLFAIPVIGFIALVIKALNGNGNINTQNYAKSFFCVYIAAAVLIGIVLVAAGGLAALGSVLESVTAAA